MGRQPTGRTAACVGAEAAPLDLMGAPLLPSRDLEPVGGVPHLRAFLQTGGDDPRVVLARALEVVAAILLVPVPLYLQPALVRTRGLVCLLATRNRGLAARGAQLSFTPSRDRYPVAPSAGMS